MRLQIEPGTESPPETGDQTVLGLPVPTTAERQTAGVAGIPMIALGLAAVIAGGVLLASHGTHALAIVLLVLGAAVAAGFTAVAPGEARVVQLFGRYSGTIRTPGLRWVSPLTRRRKVSTRIRNHETPVAKVNDADGSPIEIAAVVVWQITDTARALFEVEDHVRFVSVQTEAAVRQIAMAYPYDARGSGQLSLLDGGHQITDRLSAEIGARVALAGVRVIESRLTRLAYAPEVAQAMLRRQQAEAIVAARSRIVEGAVGMVESALAQLDERDVVVLDDERRAAMVSNLLVVLCSEQATQPVLNVGSLYQ